MNKKSAMRGAAVVALTASAPHPGRLRQEAGRAPGGQAAGFGRDPVHQGGFLTTELPGRTSPFRVAEVRPQVNGIVQKRLYTEGGDVKAGQQLYQIDPALYQATLDSQKAALARAQAQQKTAALLVERYKPLVATRAVSQQTYDNAVASRDQAAADVLSAKAALDTARINLVYTKVLSPIDGIIGRSSMTEGALVTANQAAALAAVQQIDPMYVDVTQSSVQLLRLQEALASGQLTRADGEQSAVVTLTLEDGTQYKQQGKLQFSEVTVDPGTGSVTLRAVFPNPDRRLLPGMFVRARLVDGVASQGLLVPQRGVTRNQRGEPTAMVVNAENKVELRTLKTDRAGRPVAGQLGACGGRQGDRRGSADGASRRRGRGHRGRRRRSRRSSRQRPPTRRSSKSGATHGKVFIDRPVFAWVIAIVLMMAGALSILKLPVSQYPNIAPPAIGIAVTYPGASADGAGHRGAGDRAADERPGRAGVHLVGKQLRRQHVHHADLPSGHQPRHRAGAGAEQAVAGAAAAAAGSAAAGHPRHQGHQELPDRGGLRLHRRHHDQDDLADYVASYVQDPISRTQGVGDFQLFGSQYAMRIWLNPDKLINYGLTTTDVVNAIKEQNVQVSSGQLGGLPAVRGQQLNATIIGPSRLQKPEDFGRILLKVNQDGSQVRLANVASIELGGQTYAIDSYFNGKPASGLAVKLAPGANALDTAQAVRDTINSLKPFFPPGMDVVYPYDTTPFVSLSIEEVFKTLAEAIVLVFLVMYLFLQNFRATIIPTLAVPVVLLGTFGVLAAFGYSINTLTMFGMVLAIGLLVDDAIVVVENVERVMAEEGLTPKQATRKSMTQITGALIGIAMVLAAVFIPMAFFGGSTGVIYRQFSITIVSSMVLSVIVAIVFTPALCATMLADSQGPSWRQARFLRLVQPYVRPQHRGLCQHGVARAEPWQAADAGLSGHRHRHGLDVHAHPDRVPAG